MLFLSETGQQEAYRYVNFAVTQSGIAPVTVQNGGIQGEHRATRLKFNFAAGVVSAAFITGKPLYATVKVTDGAGEIHVSNMVELSKSPETDTLYYDLERNDTAFSGIIKVRLDLLALGDEFDTLKLVKTYSALLELEGSDEVIPKIRRDIEGLTLQAKEYVGEAKDEADRAEDARDLAEGYKTDAETAATEASGYKTDAEAARDTAIGYKNTAVAAATSATNAKTAAETAAASASASKVSAETAATNAANSKTDAENAATNAGSAQTAAENAQTAAESARDLAKDYKDDAYDYKEAAEQAVASIPVEVYELSKNTHPPVAPNIPVPQLSEAEREEIAAKLQLGKVIIIKWTDTDEYGQDIIDEFTTISYDLDEVIGGIEGFRVTNGDAIADYRLYDGDLLVIYYQYESQNHKVTVINSSSTNTQYPSAKAVWDILNNFNLIPTATGGYIYKGSSTAAKAEGKLGVSRGNGTEATGRNSTAIGTTAKAIGEDATAIGIDITNSGKFATAVGNTVTVTGQDSVAHGYNLQVTQPHASALGIGLRNNVYAGIRLGKWNSDNANALMQVGNGTADNNRSNAFEVLADGTIKFGSGSLKGEDGVALSTVETKRMLYRGKNLGTSLTAAQKTAISSGTFTDLYIGDYWVINGVNWRIADIDYFYGRNFDTHHLVIVPDTTLDTMAMYDTDITSGAYVGSNVYTALNDPDSTVMQAITGAFGNNVLEHTETLQNSADANGCYNGMINGVSIKAALMNQVMLYGSYVQPLKPTRYQFDAGAAYGRTGAVMQLALFRLSVNRIPTVQHSWLRDVVSASQFAASEWDGVTTRNSSTQLGVRPYFCIGV